MTAIAMQSDKVVEVINVMESHHDVRRAIEWTNEEGGFVKLTAAQDLNSHGVAAGEPYYIRKDTIVRFWGVKENETTP